MDDRGESGASGARDESDAAAAQRSMDRRAQYVEVRIQQAMRNGEFDDLPGAGKPIPGLGGVHDPDWWIRRKIEREKLTGLGPPALTLRTEDARMDAQLDAMTSERDVRETLDDFNRRIVEARRQLLGGPPVVTKLRDIEGEVERWRERRRASAPAPASGDLPRIRRRAARRRTR